MIKCFVRQGRCRWVATLASAGVVVAVLLALVYGFAFTPALAEDPKPVQPTPTPSGDVVAPGWQNITADPVPPAEARRILFNVSRSNVRTLDVPTSETDATPEIRALARALENDPKRIFDYVHNYIDYVPTFGSKNGATGALLAGRGTDWDQASLFIALMRAAGFSANYAVGDVEYTFDRLANWVGVESDPNLVAGILANGGVPIALASGNTLRVTRAWAEATINGQTYPFDPAMKTYSETTGINLASALGYDRASFLDRARQGATLGGDWVQNLNEANVRADLASYSTNLINYLQTTMPDASLDEVIGGRRIVHTQMAAYPTTLPEALSVQNQATYTTLPDNFRATLRVQHAGIDYTFKTFQIAGKRVSIFYTGTNNSPELRVDGELAATGNATTLGFSYPLTMTVDQPYAGLGGTYGDQQRTFSLYSGRQVVIAHNFGSVSAALIAARRRLLTQAVQAGQAEDAEPVRGEGLWLIGLSGFRQMHLVENAVNRLGQAYSLDHHVVGLVAQGAGYYMDLAMVTASIGPTRVSADPAWPTRLYAMMSSALEYGVFEQLQGADRPAVSTVKLLQLANSRGDKVFLADSGNWASVRAQLQNYSTWLLSYMDGLIAAGYRLVLSGDFNLSLNAWIGVGFFTDYQSGGTVSTGAQIAGGLAGGHGSGYDIVDTKRIPDPPPVSPPTSPESQDPVDMRAGAFVLDRTDLSFESGLLQGLRFTRFYSSDDRDVPGPLGYGWRHNYQTSVARHSAWEPVLGQRLALHAAPLLTSITVALDVLRNQFDVQGWLVSDLAAKWAMDQMQDNAVSVYLGERTVTFVRRADGSYIPPPGTGLQLRQDASGSQLLDPVGLVYFFDTAGRIRAVMDRNGNTLTYAYDAGGRLATVSDALSHTLTFGYTNDLLTSVTDFAGRTLAYSYVNNTLAAFTDAAGHTWRYAYDAQNRLTQVFKAAPATQPLVTNVYDDFGRVITQTDALGNVSTFLWSDFRNVEVNPDGTRLTHHFDAELRRIAREDTLGQSAQMAYDGQWRLRTLTDRLGDTTSFTWHAPSGEWASLTNAKGETVTFTYAAQTQTFTNPLVLTQTMAFTFYNRSRADYPDGTNEQFTYDERGNVLTFRDRAGQTWTFTYNERGQVLTSANPTGGMTTSTYNDDATLASRTEADTGVTTLGYDAYKRLNRITHPDATGKQFTYDLNDRLTSVTDENGNTTTYTYDANGNLMIIADPLSQTTQLAYDLKDRLTQVTNRLGQTTTYAYDALDRLSALTDPTGVATQFGYDPRGGWVPWLNRVTHGGQSWQTAYDAEGVPSSTTTPLGYVTARQADRLGLLVGLSDPLGHMTTISRDAMGRITSIADALSRTTTFTYDGHDLLTGVTLPATGTATYQRNALGQLTRITDLGGQNWGFTYTPMGRLQSDTDPLGRTTSHSYDARGRLSRSVFPDSAVLTRTYDAASNLTGRLYSDGTDLRYTYDAHNRLVATNGLTLTRDDEGRIINNQSFAANFGASYDDAGRLKTVSYNNGAFTVTYTYSPTTALLMRVQDSLTGAFVAFSYDADFRLVGLNRSNGVNTTLTYDAAARLTRIQEGSILDLQYTLDAAGQVTQVHMLAPLYPDDFIAPGQQALTFDAASQISSTGYAYDARGRQIAAPGRTYTWDGASRLTGINATRLGYNGLGDVITRTEGATTTHFYSNYAIGLGPIVTEALQRYYVWTPDGQLLYLIDAADGNKVYFYHFDRTGSTLALTDVSGAVADAYAYDPYGRLLAHVGSSPQPFTFVGQWGVRQEDAAGTLYQMRARYYDALTGRFLSRDPIWPQLGDAQSLNPYQYARGAPVGATDVTGMVVDPAAPIHVIDCTQYQVYLDGVPVTQLPPVAPPGYGGWDLHTATAQAMLGPHATAAKVEDLAGRLQFFNVADLRLRTRIEQVVFRETCERQLQFLMNLYAGYNRIQAQVEQLDSKLRQLYEAGRLSWADYARFMIGTKNLPAAVQLMLLTEEEATRQLEQIANEAQQLAQGTHFALGRGNRR